MFQLLKPKVMIFQAFLELPLRIGRFLTHMGIQLDNSITPTRHPLGVKFGTIT